jgi:cytochrome c
MKISYVGYCLIFVATMVFSSCKDNSKEQHSSTAIPKDYIRKIPGENDSLPEKLIQKGEVLIAYSDCYTCHTRSKRAKGPSFEDIAERYPIQQPYIDMLAYRVIAGGNGAWGSPVMDPHPNLDHESAKSMVSYILSLKKKK